MSSLRSLALVKVLVLLLSFRAAEFDTVSAHFLTVLAPDRLSVLVLLDAAFLDSVVDRVCVDPQEPKGLGRREALHGSQQQRGVYAQD